MVTATAQPVRFKQMSKVEETAPPVAPYVPSNRQKLHQTDLGKALWLLVNRPDVVIRLQAASDLRVPAVRALERPLLESGLLKPRSRVIDAERSDYDQYKRMLGSMVRAVLEANGYRLKSSSPYTFKGDQFFSSGSLYESATPPLYADVAEGGDNA